MDERYVAVFPWDFKGKALANEKIKSLKYIWATFLWQYWHPTHLKFPNYPNPTPDFIASRLAKITVKSCMIYGDKMTLKHWKYMIDNLLKWVQDKKAAIRLRESNVSISSEYLWYGVLAWHELKVSTEDVRDAILVERTRIKAQQDLWTTSIMREYRSSYPDRWESNHKLCFNCPQAIKETYPQNYPWCKVRIETGQTADKKFCEAMARTAGAMK